MWTYQFINGFCKDWEIDRRLVKIDDEIVDFTTLHPSVLKLVRR